MTRYDRGCLQSALSCGPVDDHRKEGRGGGINTGREDLIERKEREELRKKSRNTRREERTKDGETE